MTVCDGCMVLAGYGHWVLLNSSESKNSSKLDCSGLVEILRRVGTESAKHPTSEGRWSRFNDGESKGRRRVFDGDE